MKIAFEQEQNILAVGQITLWVPADIEESVENGMNELEHVFLEDGPARVSRIENIGRWVHGVETIVKRDVPP